MPPCCPLGHSPAQQLSSDWGSEEGVLVSCRSVLTLSRSSRGTVTERQPEGRVLGNPDCTTVAGRPWLGLCALLILTVLKGIPLLRVIVKSEARRGAQRRY